MSAGGGSGTGWFKVLIAGGVIIVAANVMHAASIGPAWLLAPLLAVGGIAVVFGSCEAMIHCIQGIAGRCAISAMLGNMLVLRSLLSSLLLCGAALSIAPSLSACGGTQRTETGAPPAADADMKVVVLNVFGMT